MDKVERALQLYKEDKLFQSARTLEEVKKDVDALLNDETGDLDLKEKAAALQKRLNEPEIARILTEAEEVYTVKETLESKIGWTLSYDGAQTKVWYRKEAGTSSHSMLVEGEIEAPLLNLAALLYETDLYCELLWFVRHAVVLKEVGRVRRAAHFGLYAPWPLYDREVALYGYAVDGLDDDDNCVLVMSRSLRDSDGIPIPKELCDGQLGSSKRTVRAEVLFSGYELVPQTPTRTRVRFMFNADPKLAYIPTPLINWSSRTLCRWSLRALESRARNLPQSYRDRMESKEIYKWFSSRLMQYWTLKGNAEDHCTPNNAVHKESRISGSFDVTAPPDAPPRSVIATLLSLQLSSSRTGDPTATRGKSFTSRFFSFGAERERQ